MKDELYPIIDIPASVQRADKEAWKDLIEMNRELRERVIEMTDELGGDGLCGPDAVKALGLRQVHELDSEHIALLNVDIAKLEQEREQLKALLRRAESVLHEWCEQGGWSDTSVNDHVNASIRQRCCRSSSIVEHALVRDSTATGRGSAEFVP